MNIARLLRFLFFLYLSIPKSQAQEKPYYELPKNRKESSELLSMPNLRSFGIKYYFAAAGGFKKNYSVFEITPSFPIGSKTEMNLYWEVVIGQNRNYNYFWETGYISNPTYLRSNLDEINPSPFSLTFTNGQKYHAIPIRIKKRVLTIDKVAKSAFLNVGAGIIYQLPNLGTKSERDSITFNPRRNPLPNDLTSVNYELVSKNKPLAFEMMLELRGKVIERFDLSIYLKSIYKPHKQLTNTFNYTFFDTSSQKSIQYLSDFSLFFGIQVQINSPKFIKYSSTVE